MGDIVKFRSKDNYFTPADIHETFGEWIESGRLKAVAIVYLRDDGIIRTGWSENSNLEILGMFETAKQQVIDEMRDIE